MTAIAVADLPDPDSPTMRDDFAGIDVVAHAAHGVHRFVRRWGR